MSYTEPEHSDEVAPAATTARVVLRAADLVTLTVRAVGLRDEPGPNGTQQWVADGAGGRLIVELPPQHIAETLMPDTGPPSQSRLAGPSTLQFEVPANTRVVQSTTGILSAMTTLPMQNDRSSPGGGSTLELPWRLLMALQKTATCRHTTRTVQAPDGATVPMWHTHILGSSPTGYAEVRPIEALPADGDFANKTPLRGEMERIAKAGRDNPDTTIKADELILSPCGAWFSGSVLYPNLSWTHQTAMGRDYYVRLEIMGVLFPFGHRASVISVSQREFNIDNKTAGLRGQLAFVITEPSRALYVNTKDAREFPFDRVDIEPLRVIPIDRPAPPNNKAYWLRHPDGRLVNFTVRAWSPDGPVTMQLPLVFADPGVPPAQLKKLYEEGPGSAPFAVDAAAAAAAAPKPPRTYIDQAIPLVVRKVGTAFQKVDKTTVAVRSMVMSANVNGGSFYPRIAELEVMSPAVSALTGRPGAAIAATLSQEVLDGFGGPDPDKTLLRFTAAVPLDFARTEAGAVAAANMAVRQLSTVSGLSVPKFPNMKPADLFDATATVLGIVPLAKVMEKVNTRPKVTWAQDPPRAKMEWEDVLDGTVGPFQTREAPTGESLSKATIEVDTAADVGGRRAMLTRVTITDFCVGIPEPDDFYVKLEVSKLVFEATSGALPSTTFSVAGVELGRELAIVKDLGSVMKDAIGSGPSLEVNTREVKVSYALAAPTPLGLGLISIQNLIVQAGLTLSLTGGPIIVDFALGTRAHPFLVTVMGFGGGGYLELGVSAREGGGLERFVGGIEFGAMVAMNFGVAQGEVHIFGGIVFVKTGTDIEITGYVRVGGSVCVLGLITVSIELTVSLTYKTPNILKGEARLVIAVDLTLWSTSVEIPASYTITGSKSLALDRPTDALSHSVESALGPRDGSFPWRDYCQAFA